MAVGAEKLPMTVSQYAVAAGVSKSTVARMIHAGCLVVNGKRPREIVEIVYPDSLTIESWVRELKAEAAALRPGTYGFGDGGALEALVGDRRVVIPAGSTIDALNGAKAEDRRLGQ